MLRSTTTDNSDDDDSDILTCTFKMDFECEGVHVYVCVLCMWMDLYHATNLLSSEILLRNCISLSIIQMQQKKNVLNDIHLVLNGFTVKIELKLNKNGFPKRTKEKQQQQ